MRSAAEPPRARDGDSSDAGRNIRKGAGTLAFSRAVAPLLGIEVPADVQREAAGVLRRALTVRAPQSAGFSTPRPFPPAPAAPRRF